jgi:hypothetical protein
MRKFGMREHPQKSAHGSFNMKRFCVKRLELQQQQSQYQVQYYHDDSFIMNNFSSGNSLS